MTIMETVRVNAHAKINLTLDVVGAEGGYHALDSLVATVALRDRIAATRRRDGRVVLHMHGMGSERIPPARNNAVLAAERFVAAFRTAGADISVYKKIPVGGGFGGSSADAAGVLRALAALYGIADMGALKAIADGLGSDTGYLLTGGFARMQGRGDRITPLTGLPELHVLAACPRRGVSTPKCFQAFDEQGVSYPPRTERVLAALAAGDTAGAAALFGNDLFAAAAACNGEVAAALDALKSLRPLGAGMTGSGSACYAVFGTAEAADEAARRFRGDFRTIRTRTVLPAQIGEDERR